MIVPPRHARWVSRGPVDLCSDTTEGHFSVPRSQEVRWTSALTRPRGTLASREIEPKLRSSWVSRSTLHFSDNKKRTFHSEVLFCYLIERETGIEPATPSLARRCSTTEPLAHIILCCSFGFSRTQVI